MTNDYPEEKTQVLVPGLREAYEAMDPLIIEPGFVNKLRSTPWFPIHPLPDCIGTEMIQQGDLTGVLYKPPKFQSKKYPIVLLFFGGAFVCGSPKSVRNLTSSFVLVNNCLVFCPYYRFSPEYPFPAPLEDAINALKFIANHPSVDPNKIVVAGNSAGGTLAASLTLAARDDVSIPRISALILDTPTLSPVPLNSDNEIQPTFGKMWSKRNLEESIDIYTPGEKRYDPLAYPLLAPSLANFPPTIIGAAEYDIVREHSIQFANRLYKESDGGCELHVWKGTVHAGLQLAPNIAVHMQQRNVYTRFLNDCWKIMT